MKTIFLDIQGVLTRGDSRELTQLGLFEECLRASGALEEVAIVITSDWRHQFNLEQLRQMFSEDVAQRIVDVTGAECWSREREIQEYVVHFGVEEWIAIDDLVDDFQDKARLIGCSRETGFDMACGADLLEFLDGYPGPLTCHGPWSSRS